MTHKYTLSGNVLDDLITIMNALNELFERVGVLEKNVKLESRIAVIELAMKEIQDIKFWMNDHYTKWNDIDQFKKDLEYKIEVLEKK